MKIFRFTSISQWAYLIALICFLLTVFWVSTTFKPESSIGLGTPAAPPVTSSPASATVPPTTAPVVTSMPLPTATPDSRCIITVDGQRYDVTLFRRQHEGGDVFKCGSDMSRKFHDKHPAAFLTVLYPFRI